jgi:8-oxo-dGTP pyrophosphatase MutT (NUDIX family)
VAAVCYRVRNAAIEFLLVRTRGSGRWTFPKGSAEPGLTHAQAAALEAFEEAGVHGRIQETSFARYVRRKPGDGRKSAASSADKALAVNAHLCQVLRLGKPKESNRDRTWFSAAEARRALREGREGDDGAQFARVIAKAVACIQRLCNVPEIKTDHSHHDQPIDALQKIQFEALSSASYIRLRLAELRRSSAPSFQDQSRKLLQGDLLPFTKQEGDRSAKWLLDGKKVKALGTGTNSG